MDPTQRVIETFDRLVTERAAGKASTWTEGERIIWVVVSVRCLRRGGFLVGDEYTNVECTPFDAIFERLDGVTGERLWDLDPALASVLDAP